MLGMWKRMWGGSHRGLAENGVPGRYSGSVYMSRQVDLSTLLSQAQTASAAVQAAAFALLVKPCDSGSHSQYCCAGIWAQKVQHPSSGLTKEYVVTCSAPPTRQDLEKIADGCEVDGTFVRPVAVAPIREPGRRPGIRIVIAEGRNREVGLLYLHLKNALHKRSVL